MPHSFHLHGLEYGIDSDGSWPFGTQAADGRRSDEICPGQHWTYTFDVRDEMLGAWPFHSHCRDIGPNTNRGLFGGIIVLDREDHEELPTFDLPDGFHDRILEIVERLGPKAGVVKKRPSLAQPPARVVDVVRPAMPMPMPMGVPMPAMPMPMPMPMPMGGAGHEHGVDLDELPSELVPAVATLEELAHASQRMPHPRDVLHVPLFFHQMSGLRGSPVFQSAPLNPGQVYEMTFTIPGIYDYICGVHGPSMAGRIRVDAAGPALVDVQATGANTFVPADVDRRAWAARSAGRTQAAPSTAWSETGGANRPSLCFNGRSFIGNAPTIVRGDRPDDPLVRVQPRPGDGLAQLPPPRPALGLRRRGRSTSAASARPSRSWSRPRRLPCCCCLSTSRRSSRSGTARSGPRSTACVATSWSTATSRCT